MAIPNQITRNLFRGLRLLDVPDVMRHFRFQDLRRAYYADFWQKAAVASGAQCEAWGYGYHRIVKGGKTTIVRQSEVRLDDHLTLDIMGNKVLTYRLMAEQGCRVPQHVRCTVSNLAPAIDLLRRLGRPLVVKPVGGTGGGRGVTTGITSATDLRRAAWFAARYDTDILVEEQIAGHSYRLLYLDGRLIDAVRRDPPRLTGDGRKTIRQLVDAENARRLTGRPFTALSPLRLDRDACNYLASQGLSPSSRPAAGETVVVKRAVNENTAAENHIVRDQVHPATAELGGTLATNLGVRLAGIDVIAHDIALPLTPDNGLIGEINTTPGLHHHQLVSNSNERAPVPETILDYLFELNTGVIRKSKLREVPIAVPMKQVAS